MAAEWLSCEGMQKPQQPQNNPVHDVHSFWLQLENSFIHLYPQSRKQKNLISIPLHQNYNDQSLEKKSMPVHTTKTGNADCANAMCVGSRRSARSGRSFSSIPGGPTAPTPAAKSSSPDGTETKL